MHVPIGGRTHRVYWEEAGAGIPLVCLHTAGADGRQFRHLMNDPSVTDAYRVIAFDMPWHGKSYPPEGFEAEEYRLTTQGYTDTIRAVCAGLGLDRPVVMGCSIGGRIVLNLAIRHAAEFRALIGLEAAERGRAGDVRHVSHASEGTRRFEGATDLYQPVSTIPAGQAFRPVAEGGCPLVKGG